MIREIPKRGLPGLPTVLVLLPLIGVVIWRIIVSANTGDDAAAWYLVPSMLVLLTCLGGLVIVHPNEARVLVLFGKYAGSLRHDGFWWVNPFMEKKKLSLRVRNFETSKLKVNDSHSNPIEIGAVVVWRVVDSAEALFEVDDYEHYVTVQSESAVRSLASRYPYDAHTPDEVALSTNPEQVSRDLLTEVQERLGKAGVEVLEARLTHLAYAPEIASAMLQRQQAGAIIAARQRIVEGAVGMVENALALLSSREIITLDDERKATMVSNLLVVLCSERGTTPVVNAGSLYQ